MYDLLYQKQLFNLLEIEGVPQQSLALSDKNNAENS